MKKLFTLFVTALMAFSAKADYVTNLENGLYQFKNTGDNRGTLAYDPSVTTMPVLAGITYTNCSNNGPALNADGVNLNWGIVKAKQSKHANSYYIYSPANNKFLSWTTGDNYAKYSDTPCPWQFYQRNIGGTNYTILTTDKFVSATGNGNKGLSFACGTVKTSGQLKAQDNALTTSTDGGIKYVYEKQSGESSIPTAIANAIDTYEFNPAEVFNANKVYVIDNENYAHRGKLAYNPDNTDYVALADVTLTEGQTNYANRHTSSNLDAVGIYWQIKVQADGKVQLYNLQNGKYASVRSASLHGGTINVCAWSDDPYDFAIEKKDGAYCFKGNGTPNTNYLSIGCGWNPNEGPVYLEGTAVANERKLAITEAEEVTFTTSTPASTFEGGLNGKSVGTFSSPYPVQLPEGVKAYTASVSDNTVTFTEFGRNIPRNVGVLLYAEDGTNHSNEATTPAYTNATASGNALRAANGEIVAGTYVLGNGSNGVGFYARVNPTTVANKAYLEVPAGSNLSAFRFDFEDTVTSIEAIESNTIETVFDLQGRRVQGAKSGLYIVNGKKVIK